MSSISTKSRKSNEFQKEFKKWMKTPEAEEISQGWVYLNAGFTFNKREWKNYMIRWFQDQIYPKVNNAKIY